MRIILDYQNAFFFCFLFAQNSSLAVNGSTRMKLAPFPIPSLCAMILPLMEPCDILRQVQAETIAPGRHILGAADLIKLSEYFS